MAVVAVGHIAVSAATLTMMDVSLSCAKVGEGGSEYRCDDWTVSVLGVWPLLGVCLLLAGPAALAAVVARQTVSWLSVASYLGLTIVGLMNVTTTSYLSLLVVSFPLALVGAVMSAAQGRRRAARSHALVD